MEETIVKNADLDALVRDLYTAKRNEETAKAARILIEEKIAALVPTKENGSRTVDSGTLRVTVKRANTYKIDDPDRFRETYPNFVKIVPEKVEIDVKAYEAAREADAPEWVEASRHVEVAPRKVSVTLKA